MSTVDHSPLVLSPPALTAKRRFLLDRADALLLIEAGLGYALIMATIWTEKATQRWLFWISAAYFLCWAAIAWKKIRLGLKLPSAKIAASVVLAGMLVAGSCVAFAADLGTMHRLFGRKDPLLHAGSYLLWAILQQIILQVFFLARFEQIIQRGAMASLLAAGLFGLAHLPNPVLTPVTFFGGWLMCELFRRYRSVLPLGIAHGLVGMALAVSVPDHIQHHMRVGLGYLTYLR